VYIEQWMKRKVLTVKPLDSIEHAREIMANQRVNQLPVMADGRLVGILTDRDVREAFPSVFEGPIMGKSGPRSKETDPRRIPVELVMTPNVLTLTPRNTVEEATRLMRRERVGAIPILDGDRLVGILTRSDVLDAFVELAERQTSGAPAPPARSGATKPRPSTRGRKSSTRKRRSS